MSERKANFIGTSYWSNKCSINKINNHLAEIPKEKKFILHCAGGYRSMIAASILKQRMG
jgi:rhodanese-related sulfurtransferase